VSAREKQLATLKMSSDELTQEVNNLREELAAAVQAQEETRAAVDAQLQVRTT
jgi:cell division protein FtsB